MSLHGLYSDNVSLIFSYARVVVILKSVDISPCTMPIGGLQPCLRGVLIWADVRWLLILCHSRGGVCVPSLWPGQVP